MKSVALLAAVGIATVMSMPARADLINSTINADIELMGQDDNGSYDIDVFTGPISVGSGFSQSYSFSRQDTFGGFSTPTNVLDGSIGLTITGNTITLTFNGQAQPVELTGTFTALPAVQSVSEADSGFTSGVNLPFAPSFSSTSDTISAFYLGFQPGTSTSQTDTLTFGTGTMGVPEPATWAMLLASLLGMGAMVRAAKRNASRIAEKSLGGA